MEENKRFLRSEKTTEKGRFLTRHKRVSQGRKPITLLFCVGSNTLEPGKKITPSRVLERTPTNDGVKTNQEIRRLYRICHGLKVSSDSEVRTLADLAERATVMVTVDYNKFTQKYALNRVPNIWDAPGWNDAWIHRTQTHPTDRTKQQDPLNHEKKALNEGWRRELRYRVHRYALGEKIKTSISDLWIQKCATFLRDILLTMDRTMLNKYNFVKEALLLNPNVEARYKQQAKDLGIAPELFLRDFVNDPCFEEIYDKAIYSIEFPDNQEDSQI